MHETKLTFAEKALLSKASEGIIRGLLMVADEPFLDNPTFREFYDAVENPEVMSGVIAESITDKLIKWETLKENPELILESVNFTECTGLFVILAEGIVANGLGASHRNVLKALAERASMLKLVEDAQDMLDDGALLN